MSHRGRFRSLSICNANRPPASISMLPAANGNIRPPRFLIRLHASSMPVATPSLRYKLPHLLQPRNNRLPVSPVYLPLKCSYLPQGSLLPDPRTQVLLMTDLVSKQVLSATRMSSIFKDFQRRPDFRPHRTIRFLSPQDFLLFHGKRIQQSHLCRCAAPNGYSTYGLVLSCGPRGDNTVRNVVLKLSFTIKVATRYGTTRKNIAKATCTAQTTWIQ